MGKKMQKRLAIIKLLVQQRKTKKTARHRQSPFWATISRDSAPPVHPFHYPGKQKGIFKSLENFYELKRKYVW